MSRPDLSQPHLRLPITSPHPIRTAMRFFLRQPAKFIPELILAAAMLVSRWPLVVSGYGSDGDAWRVAYASAHLWDSGEYIASRLPGYPLHELLMAPIAALGGSVGTNIATLLAFASACVIWYRWCREHARHPLILMAALAFAPIAWIASATTIDYAWSLLFLIASMSAASRSRVIAAGILLGIAAGFRPSNLAFAAVPLALLYHLPDRRSHLITFLTATLATTATAFLPVLISLGPIEWSSQCISQLRSVNMPWMDRTLAAGYRAVYAFGPLAVLAGCFVLISGRKEILTCWRDKDPVVLASVLGLIALGIAFWMLPAERAYLLPAIPLILLLIDRTASKAGLWICVVLLMSFAFVNPDVVRHAGMRGTPGFELRPGLLIEELVKRKAIDAQRAQVREHVFSVPTIILTGRSAQIWFENGLFSPDPQGLSTFGHFPDPVDPIDIPARRRGDPKVIVASTLRPEVIRRAQASGWQVACLIDAQAYVESIGGFQCDEEHVLVLPAPTRSADL